MKPVWMLLAITVPAVWALPPLTVTKASLVEIFSKNGDAISKNSAFESILWDLLDNLREIILEGSGIIPPLDPLNIPRVDLDDETIPLPGARVTLTEVTVSNLGSFEVDQLSVTRTSILLQRYRIRLDIRIPVLEATAGGYDLDVSALGFNVFGSGDLQIKIKNPKVSLNLLVGPSIIGGISLNLIDCTVKFELTDFEIQVTGLFNHSGASDFVNLFLADLVPTLVKTYEPEITEFLSTNVHSILDQILADLDIGDLISP